MKLTGKTVMVTGAGGCIGRATAEAVASEGASVILCDLTEEAVSPVAQQIKEKGGNVLICPFDVTNYAEAVRAAQYGIQAFGHIDTMINVAGGSANLIKKLSRFADSEPETWEYVMRLNVQGSFNCVHAVINHMIERKQGRIILFSSIAGVNGLAGRADYSAAKGALISFVKALAMEVGKYRIAVNCVSPGAIHRHNDPSNHVTYWGENGSSSGPEPVARMCAFLASDDSEFITGQNIQVDGGRTLGSLIWPKN